VRIGIDGSCLSNRRGFGRFARQTLAALARAGSAHEFTVYVDQYSSEAIAIPDNCQRVIVHVSESPSKAASAHTRRTLRDMLAMSRAVARDRPDLMFFPASYTFYPVWNVRRVVVTLHDTLALARPELVFPTLKGRWAWALKERLAVARADRILTVSEASRRALIAWFRLDPARVVATTEGPDGVFRPMPPDGNSDTVLRRHGIDPTTRYLLYVGGLSPHKNLPRLVEAFAAGAPSDLRLALVGDFNDTFHTRVPEIRRAIANHGLDGRVQFTGFVPDDELAHLYSRAQALVFPSLMEGFGLPAVEAMACGIPVLHSLAGSLPEVVGDAGLAFDPTDVSAIASVIRSYFADGCRRERLAQRALERSKLFTWEASAQHILACFESLSPADARERAPLKHRPRGPWAPRRVSRNQCR
jgi:glycosyltransferase involved in cell wall biosynthesis